MQSIDGNPLLNHQFTNPNHQLSGSRVFIVLKGSQKETRHFAGAQKMHPDAFLVSAALGCEGAVKGNAYVEKAVFVASKVKVFAALLLSTMQFADSN